MSNVQNQIEGDMLQIFLDDEDASLHLDLRRIHISPDCKFESAQFGHGQTLCEVGGPFLDLV